jgi:hypothetical protein
VVESIWPRLTKQPKSIAGRGAGGAIMEAEYGIPWYRMGARSTSLAGSLSRCLAVSPCGRPISSRFVLHWQARGRLHVCSPQRRNARDFGLLRWVVFCEVYAQRRVPGRQSHGRLSERHEWLPCGALVEARSP